MNEHEIERIAKAINVARPDWPAKSLQTLIAAKLADKPRRDVFVALAWIACETNTATPARVLEAGPWWRAAAVEGATAQRNATPATACRVCGQSPTECARRWSGDHDYTPPGSVRAVPMPETIRAALAQQGGSDD